MIQKAPIYHDQFSLNLLSVL